MDVLKRFWPVWVVLSLATAFVLLRLAQSGWEPEHLAEVGTRFSEGAVDGSEGYDGQFALYMAQDLRPQRVSAQLDVPAYRYQRVLLPLLGRIAALGNPAWVGWSLIGLNLVAHGLGTMALVAILEHYRQWTGHALLYGLFVGVFAGVGADLLEPLAYGLVALSLYLRIRGYSSLAVLILGAALFAKETTLPFMLAFMMADAFGQRLNQSAFAYVVVVSAYTGWQMWLWFTFGEPGLGSGGAYATAFEIIPFMGFFRIVAVSWRVFLAYLLIFGPGVILPTVWAILHGVRWLPSKRASWLSWSVFLNALVIVVLPFSTFREPLGLLRLAAGLVLSALVLWAKEGQQRPLRYGWFWLSYLALLL